MQSVAVSAGLTQTAVPKLRGKSVRIKDQLNEVKETSEGQYGTSGRNGELENLQETVNKVAEQLMDFFSELKTKIYEHRVPRSKMLDSFLDTKIDELTAYANRDPTEFLQIIESIVLVHMDKIANYKGPKFITEDFLNGGLNRRDEDEEPRKKGDIVFKSRYSNMIIKKRKPDEKDVFGNKQLYDLVFNQEVHLDSPGERRRMLRRHADRHRHEVPRAAEGSCLFSQEYNELVILANAEKRRNQILNTMKEDQSDKLLVELNVADDERGFEERKRAAARRDPPEELATARDEGTHEKKRRVPAADGRPEGDD